jgi:hypothetical protein
LSAGAVAPPLQHGREVPVTKFWKVVNFFFGYY